MVLAEVCALRVHFLSEGLCSPSASSSFIYLFICLFINLQSRRRYHRAQRDSICLSVCRLSVCRLSVCHQTPPSLWYRSLPKFIFGFFRPLRGSVKIWYWPQSNPPPPNAPQKWPPKMNFFYCLTYWLEILYISSWPLPHHKSGLES